MSLYKVSVRGVLARSLYIISLKKKSLSKIAALFTRPLYKISIKGLLARSLYKNSIVFKSSVGKISARGLLARSLNKISRRGLFTRSLYKLPIRSPLARCLCEISRFVRACAIEMHMDISQEPICAEIFRETAGRDGYHVDQPAGPNTIRTPQCGHTVWGINLYIYI